MLSSIFARRCCPGDGQEQDLTSGQVLTFMGDSSPLLWTPATPLTTSSHPREKRKPPAAPHIQGSHPQSFPTHCPTHDYINQVVYFLYSDALTSGVTAPPRGGQFLEVVNHSPTSAPFKCKPTNSINQTN